VKSLVLAFRIFLLAVAVIAVAAAVLMGRGADRRGDSRVRYVCPMHAEVTSTAPGACPICGMDLERIKADVSGPVTATVKASTYQTYDTPRRRAYGPDMPAPAWVEGDGAVAAVLYTDELAFRAPEEAATFSPASAPDSKIDVRATADAPEPWDAATRLVRFRPADPTAALRPRDVGWLKRALRSPEPPVVPYSAILESADGPYVLVLSPDGQMLSKRRVEIGRVFGGVAAVLSGLRPTERVLTGSAFFLDAERRLRQKTTIEVAQR
jgi:multidrug efflux pump subunit AcrA (membrane-fusion protein)